MLTEICGQHKLLLYRVRASLMLSYKGKERKIFEGNQIRQNHLFKSEANMFETYLFLQIYEKHRNLDKHFFTTITLCIASSLTLLLQKRFFMIFFYSSNDELGNKSTSNSVFLLSTLLT